MHVEWYSRLISDPLVALQVIVGIGARPLFTVQSFVYFVRRPGVRLLLERKEVTSAVVCGARYG